MCEAKDQAAQQGRAATDIEKSAGGTHSSHVEEEEASGVREKGERCTGRGRGNGKGKDKGEGKDQGEGKGQGKGSDIRKGASCLARNKRDA